MADPRGDKIDFEHTGIGAALAHNRLIVPLNQREYSWATEHVQALLEDFNNSISGGKSTYFLGTVVLTRSGGGSLEVADGQQRLATTAIFLAAVRDYLWNNSDQKRASSVEQEFLLQTDLATEQIIPRLKLNVDDNEFFTKAILTPPGSPDRNFATQKDSHRRLKEAATFSADYLRKILDPHKEGTRVQRIVEWVKFVKDGAQVILLTVPDHLDAFVMFETLNDRGLRASQADLLKNHLLSQAGQARISEAQQKWASMIGCLESLDIEDIVVTYLRHVVICRHGPTIKRELFEKVRATVSSQARALDFVSDISSGAATYSAIFNPEHAFWNEHGSAMRGYVHTLLELRVEQIRPLMFAVMRRFDGQEMKAAFRLFVSWSVRFLIAGGGRGGVLDKAYGTRAEDVMAGKITTARGLAKAMDDVVPTDAVFEAAFKDARVSQTFLGRYYLRALELKVKGEADPETIPNESDAINLEHVMPENPSADWEIDDELLGVYCRRLGNMALLKAKKNVLIGNKTFPEKVAEYKQSAFMLTKEIADNTTWGPIEINARQARLAKLAVQTWTRA